MLFLLPAGAKLLGLILLSLELDYLEIGVIVLTLLRGVLVRDRSLLFSLLDSVSTLFSREGKLLGVCELTSSYFLMLEGLLLGSTLLTLGGL